MYYIYVDSYTCICAYEYLDMYVYIYISPPLELHRAEDWEETSSRLALAAEFGGLLQAWKSRTFTSAMLSAISYICE